MESEGANCSCELRELSVLHDDLKAFIILSVVLQIVGLFSNLSLSGIINKTF